MQPIKGYPSACLLVCYPRIAALLALRLIVLEVRYFDIAVRKQQLMEVPVACSAGVPFVAFWGEIAAAWAAVLDSLRGAAGAGCKRAVCRAARPPGAIRA